MVGFQIPNPLDPFNGHYRQSKARTPRTMLVVFFVFVAVLIAPPLCYGIFLALQAAVSSRPFAICAAGAVYLTIVFHGPSIYDAVRRARSRRKERRPLERYSPRIPKR